MIRFIRITQQQIFATLLRHIVRVLYHNTEIVLCDHICVAKRLPISATAELFSVSSGYFPASLSSASPVEEHCQTAESESESK